MQEYGISSIKQMLYYEMSNSCSFFKKEVKNIQKIAQFEQLKETSILNQLCTLINGKRTLHLVTSPKNHLIFVTTET